MCPRINLYCQPRGTSQSVRSNSNSHKYTGTTEPAGGANGHGFTNFPEAALPIVSLLDVMLEQGG